MELSIPNGDLSPKASLLREILCKADKVDKMKDKLGFEGAITVEAQGHSGGTDLLWRYKNEATLISLSYHIDDMVEISGWHKFRLTSLYGEPNRARRSATWELIRSLNTYSEVPWRLIGDIRVVPRR